VQQEQEEGHNACIAFATDEAECRDLLILRKFLESPCDSDFAAEKGQPIAAAKKAAPSNVVNLMDARRASLKSGEKITAAARSEKTPAKKPKKRKAGRCACAPS